MESGVSSWNMHPYRAGRQGKIPDRTRGQGWEGGVNQEKPWTMQGQCKAGGSFCVCPTFAKFSGGVGPMARRPYA